MESYTGWLRIRPKADQYPQPCVGLDIQLVRYNIQITKLCAQCCNISNYQAIYPNLYEKVYMSSGKTFWNVLLLTLQCMYSISDKYVALFQVSPTFVLQFVLYTEAPLFCFRVIYWTQTKEQKQRTRMGLGMRLIVCTSNLKIKRSLQLPLHIPCKTYFWIFKWSMQLSIHKSWN